MTGNLTAKQSHGDMQDLQNTMQMRIYKKELIDRLKTYKKSRTGLFTFLFRDRDLTQQKMLMADEMITYIKNFQGNKNDLIDYFKNRLIENAHLSVQYGKYHYNLDKKNTTVKTYYDYDECGHKIYYDRKEKVVKPGQSSNMSDFANLIQDAIDWLRSQVNQNINFMPVVGKI